MRRALLDKARERVEDSRPIVKKAAQAISEVREAQQTAQDSGRPVDKLKTAVKIVAAVRAVQDCAEINLTGDSQSNSSQSTTQHNNSKNKSSWLSLPSASLMSATKAAVAHAVLDTALPTPPPVLNYSKYLNQVNAGGGIRDFLAMNSCPVGLQDSFLKSLDQIGFRFFICDDSGSMATQYGVYVSTSPDHKSIVKCTRWRELTESLKFHSSLACVSNTPSEFRLLNRTTTSPLLLGVSDGVEQTARHNTLLSYFDGTPSGGTPLCAHIRQVTETIRAMEHDLCQRRQKALVVIATDGEASDGNLAAAMRPLKNLPVWVIIRFCTNDQRIVRYWNEIDAEVELNLDILDDFIGEANEIYRYNPWITYGEPLQRLREFGLSVKELDLLDERKLSLEEVRKICSLIYDGQSEGYPHPEADWEGFITVIKEKNHSQAPVWNPITKTLMPWVNPHMLEKVYKRHGSCCTVC